MSYDPFGRGPHPVGVRTATLSGSVPDRRLFVEVWYPAAPDHAGRDVDPVSRDTYELLPGMPRASQDAVRDAAPATASWPLIAFSHGFGGHRRQSTFLCTHLASHGYVVAAVDHAGNTMPDVLRHSMAVRAGREPPDFAGMLRDLIRLRPEDVAVLIDGVLSGDAAELAHVVDSERIGVSGHSFGGWTALTSTARDPRIRAALALAPAGGDIPGFTTTLADTVDLAWRRNVPALFVVADEDVVLPLESMHELYGRTPDPKRMVVIDRADHMHFCDRAAEIHEIFRAMPPPGAFENAARRARPFVELCPADDAYDVIRALGLAHFDSVLKADEAARTFLEREWVREFGARGLRAHLCTDTR